MIASAGFMERSAAVVGAGLAAGAGDATVDVDDEVAGAGVAAGAAEAGVSAGVAYAAIN